MLLLQKRPTRTDPKCLCNPPFVSSGTGLRDSDGLLKFQHFYAILGPGVLWRSRDVGSYGMFEACKALGRV